MKRFLVIAFALVGIGGVAYLTTLGCSQMLSRKRSPAGWVEGLALAPEQRQAVAAAQEQFMAQKKGSCRLLCAKRAQMIQILKQPDPDRSVLAQLAEEIGREQTALETATLDYLLSVNRQLEPPQRDRLMASVSEELRTACRMTACGMTEGCTMKGEESKQ
ncbi:MAG: periplasmic heavy metal sensor [Candidatus Omnitrophota bacterium]|nr:periplasmic heavy metal sensor [Candidatus Omnitrophota bacterium]